jgi:hypothetical protein
VDLDVQPGEGHGERLPGWPELCALTHGARGEDQFRGSLHRLLLMPMCFRSLGRPLLLDVS